VHEPWGSKLMHRRRDELYEDVDSRWLDPHVVRVRDANRRLDRVGASGPADGAAGEIDRIRATGDAQRDVVDLRLRVTQLGVEDRRVVDGEQLDRGRCGSQEPRAYGECRGVEGVPDAEVQPALPLGGGYLQVADQHPDVIQVWCVILALGLGRRGCRVVSHGY
jgi:hypothetical protein